LRRITRSLGVLAGLALAAGLSVAPASAATHPAVGTKAQWQAAIAHVRQPGTGCYHASYPALTWHAVQCVAAPKLPVVPAAIGDGADYSAKVTGLISKAVGTFTNVSSNISEKGKVGNEGKEVANGFSLQLNTQFFSGSPACAGAKKPAKCLAWQQFVYTYQNKTKSYVFMQYWLIDYAATCPSGWFTYSTDCYTNSKSAAVPTLTAKDLATLQLSGSAAAGGNDAVSLTVGSGSATTVTNKDTKIDLAAAWNTTEWGVFGDGGGGEAYFGANNSLTAQTALTATSSGAPSCIKAGYTGETNNLKLAHTPALGSEPSPTMASKQTDGTAGTASCATAS
jgi:hypothetical protein